MSTVPGIRRRVSHGKCWVVGCKVNSRTNVLLVSEERRRDKIEKAGCQMDDSKTLSGFDQRSSPRGYFFQSTHPGASGKRCLVCSLFLDIPYSRELYIALDPSPGLGDMRDVTDLRIMGCMDDVRNMSVGDLRDMCGLSELVELGVSNRYNLSILRELGLWRVMGHLKPSSFLVHHRLGCSSNKIDTRQRAISSVCLQMGRAVHDQ